MHKFGIFKVVAGLMIALTIFGSATYADQGEALAEAARAGDSKQIQRLLDEGADVNARGDTLHWTALMEACSRGHLNVVKLLLDNGAEVNDVTDKCGGKRGGTALMAAGWTGQTDVMQLLLEKGADINVAEIAGVSVLGVASLRNHNQVVELLKAAGAERLGPGYNKKGMPSTIARPQNSLKQVQALLLQGARPCGEIP